MLGSCHHITLFCEFAKISDCIWRQTYRLSHIDGNQFKGFSAIMDINITIQRIVDFLYQNSETVLNEKEPTGGKFLTTSFNL